MSVAVNMAPAPEPQPLEGSALEAAAREELCRKIGLRVVMRAPTWRQLMFGLGRLDFTVPQTPDGVLDQLKSAPSTEQADTPTNEVETLAGALLHNLQIGRPQGVSPRSISPRRPLAPPRSAMAGWHRKIFLITSGPGSLRLLAGAGILSTSDVETLGEFYPEGLDEERTATVEAATALAAAAQRNNHDADLPAWLNDQLFTVMGEDRPTDYLKLLFAPDAEDQKPHGGGTVASAPKSRLVDQTAPTPSPGETT